MTDLLSGQGWFNLEIIHMLVFIATLIFFYSISPSVKLLWKQSRIKQGRKRKKKKKKKGKNPPIIKISNSGCFPVNYSWMKACSVFSVTLPLMEINQSIQLFTEILKGEGKTPKKRMILSISIYLAAQGESVSAEAQSAAAAAPEGKTLPVFLQNSPCTFLFSFFLERAVEYLHQALTLHSAAIQISFYFFSLPSSSSSKKSFLQSKIN